MEQPALDGTSTLNALRRLEGPVPEFPYLLVVDDQQVVRDFLKRCLEGSGVVVKLAGSAAIALELMTTAPASVVLCDIRMPGHDGIWLAERIRESRSRSPVVRIL